MTGESGATTLVFFDGLCGLCDRFVHFLLTHDRRGALRFAPLQGETARRELTGRGYDPRDLDTVYVLAEWHADRPVVLARSRAVLHALAQLGHGWRTVAWVGALAPQPLADALYRFIARRRYRVFGRYDVCPLPRPEWRARFIEDRAPGSDEIALTEKGP